MIIIYDDLDFEVYALGLIQKLENATSTSSYKPEA